MSSLHSPQLRETLGGASSRPSDFVLSSGSLSLQRPRSPLSPLRRREPAGQLCYLLEEDPDLAEALPVEVRLEFTRLLRAPMLCVEGPQWEPPHTDPQTTLGFLILDGLIARRLRIDSAVATELLGCGDVLRPGDEPGMANFIPPEIDWQVYSPARVAVLDERLTTLLTTRPELVVAVSDRVMRRARSQSYLLAVSHFTRVEDRLMATFWHLASSWGRVTSHGILIPFRLTHAMLAELVGAQRPSVSLALKGLSFRGHVVRRPDGTYLLTGEPTDWIHRADDG